MGSIAKTVNVLMYRQLHLGMLRGHSRIDWSNEKLECVQVNGVKMFCHLAGKIDVTNSRRGNTKNNKRMVSGRSL